MRLFTLLIFTLILLNCSASRNYKASDHYLPKKDRFYNPTSPALPKGLWSVLKWRFTETPADWPKWIELTEKPKLKNPLKEHQANIIFINHSTVLIQLDGLNILTDPVWSKRVSPVSWLGPQRVHAPGIPFKELPRIDLVLISHNHYDHLDSNTLIQLEKAHSPLFLCALGDKELLTSLGLKKVIEMDWWENTQYKKANITFTPTQHWSGRGLFDRFKSLWGSYLVEYKGRKIYFAGDTAHSQYLQQIARRFAPIDLAFLPIGAYAPRWFMQNTHMDPEEAVWAHKDLQAARSIAIHFGTFQLSNEAHDAPETRLNTYKKYYKIQPEEFLTLKPGQSILMDL